MDNPQDFNSTQQSEKPLSFGKQMKEFLPYFSGLIILLGLTRQIVYYSYYGVEIQNYIGVSELLLAWMDEAICFFFLVWIVTFFFMFSSKFWQTKLHKSKTYSRTIRTYRIFAIAFFMLIYVSIFKAVYYGAAFCTTLFFLFFYLSGFQIQNSLKTVYLTISLKALQIGYVSIGVFITFILLTVYSDDADHPFR